MKKFNKQAALKVGLTVQGATSHALNRSALEQNRLEWLSTELAQKQGIP